MPVATRPGGGAVVRAGDERDADPVVAEKNVATGVAAVFIYADHLAEHLPALDLGELRSRCPR